MLNKLNQNIFSHSFELKQTKCKAYFKYLPVSNKGNIIYEVEQLYFFDASGAAVTNLLLMQEALAEFLKLEAAYYDENYK